VGFSNSENSEVGVELSTSILHGIGLDSVAWDSQTVRTVRLEWNCPQAFFMELDWTAHDPELLTTTCLSEPILYLYLNTSPISCVLL